MALDGTSMSGSTTITILGRMLAVMAASRAARASPAKCCLHRHDDAEGDAARGRHGHAREGWELLAHALEEARFR